MKTLVFWLLMVLVLSLYPFGDLSRYSFGFADKLLHFFIYAVTCALLYTVFMQSGSVFLRRRALVLSVLAASAYGLAMEIAQGFVGSRSFSVYDEAVNVLGAVAAAIYIRRIKEVRK